MRFPDRKHFTSFTYPGSLFTYPNDMNALGAITGFCNVGFVNHGFVRSPDGTLTSFDPPGAGTMPHMGQGTFPFSINLFGAITGLVVNTDGSGHGFVRLAPSK